MPDRRPDPADLLTRAEREEARRGRGKLKIFFGSAPGVGKTYSMLAAVQRLGREGVDIVIGLVETHGRTETEQMLLGLDILPRREAQYRGPDRQAVPVTLREFDLDAALTRKPEFIVLDELAHTNAPGSRFEKRWQDVEELLQAGINVYTTLNVQHIESLNDVVAQITGVQVRETVPDSVADEADEIELVDLPPEVLLERLKTGRVYVPESIQAASESFFRLGNLIALRELALRRTAQWVDRQMREYKAGQGIRTIWPAAERILVAVSPSPASGKIVRAAKRMAAGLHADLLAVYVETPRTASIGQADRDRVMQTLRLAESLGAGTSTLSGTNAAAELVAFARARNVSKIVVGKTGRSRLREALLGSFMSNLVRLSGDIDIYVIRGDSDAAPSVGDPVLSAIAGLSRLPNHRHGAWRYLLASGVMGLCTLLGLVVLKRLDLSNIAMLYLAGVVVTAVWAGRGPAVLAAILGVAAFDYFFVPPRLTFAVSDVQYVLTFVVMTGVGLLIASLTSRLGSLAEAARLRERRTSLLYAMSRELAAARDRREVATVSARHVHDSFGCDAALLLPGPVDHPAAMEVVASAGSPDWIEDAGGRERGVARWAFDHGKAAGIGTQSLPGSTGRFQPLTSSLGKIGVLALRPREADAFSSTPQQLLLDTFVNQISLALERVSLIEGQQAARIEAEAERLRGALLSSVSHDLRTPLATIAGAATVLQSGRDLDEPTRTELIDSIIQEADRLNDLIANLMFATRLEAGGVELRREWATVEELVGSGLARHRDALRVRPFGVRVSPDLPLVRVDNAILPQVVHNLVDNALRYTPDGTPVEVAAWATESNVIVKVADQGPGLTDDERAKVFHRFYRGRAAQPTGSRSGIGLGLTICEGIIKAHGGRIWAEPNSPRGVAFYFSLPIDRPQPVVPAEVSEAVT
ncbi:MAG: sensor histidine kinase KdpD [Phycisphaeraceae bacterium]|nr:sensor histidine kinase KdpD [Phycisphaeraceae bacterium]